ncbi:nibrin isoform X2 [Parasteatoda tepidariorum]|nr:nibrin isoform X2 [Parasteatoda tepidariorum]
MITNDPSVSRKHAVLSVKHPEENLGNPLKPSSLFLRDEGSKYGTFKNGVRISIEVELQDNDVVKFGQFESEYRVCKLPLVVTTSCLDVSGKRTLKKTIHSLGGHFVSEWQPSCSHLVMSEVKVTIKALCCLCSAKPIVKPDYFVDLLNSLTTSSKIICPKQYIPPIGEALIDKDVVSFDINNQRKSLFENKNFFFLDEKQFKKLHLGIVLGGGNASILSSEKVSSDLLSEEGSCVIEPAKEFSQVIGRETLSDVLSILQSNKLRLIPESDVGLAVAYCSTEKFCNPKFSMGDAMFNGQNLQSQTLSVREVYVPDTQERIVSSEQAKGVVPDIDNSLNLTSFRADAVEEMELSEIPLSAQVKRELDDIFDEPMEIPNSPPKLKADTSVANSLEKTRKLKPEASLVAENEKSPVRILNTEPTSNFRTRRQLLEKRCSESPKKNPPSNKQIKKEENNLSDENQEIMASNERISVKPEEPDLTKMNELLQPELPSNLMKVEIVSLVCKRNKPLPQAQKYKNCNVKNFKKFKKVYPKKSQALPKIIGAHELVPYDKVTAQIPNEEWDDHAEEVIQPIRGAFDWDTPSV